MGLRTFGSRILGPFGLVVVKKKSIQNISAPLVLHEFIDENGEFDYNLYKEIQTGGNKGKIEFVWVQEENIKIISEYLQSVNPNIKRGICHGTRRGVEQQYFMKYTNAEVFGTEISDTATDFPDTIQWDFHETKPEWIDAFDFVYSNSLDHAHDPKKALSAWMSCLKPGGLCVIEHSDTHSGSGATELDPFGAAMHIMPFLITLWGNGRFGVRRIFSVPSPPMGGVNCHAIVIERFANPDAE